MLQSSRFVTLDAGRRLRVFDAGPYHSGRSSGGSPLVVLESGLGAGGRSWASVFHRLAPGARVLAYDRAGYGASDPVPSSSRAATPRGLEQLRDDLLAVIRDAVLGDDAATGTGPIILVGHSWGGVIVRAVAAARIAAGERVDGLVLVDPSDEHAEFYFAAGARRIDLLQARLMAPLARAGLLRPLVAGSLLRLPRKLRRETAADSATLAAARAISAETSAFLGDLKALRTSPLELGNVPVRIVSGIRADYGVASIRAQLREAHRRSAAAFLDGELIDAPASAHGVPFTDAQLVADTIMRLARASRER
ncbi:hydrolase or acyltransferase of alpha/beta superfamily protein [Pseudoclavibacter endophyticus]|uniref:Alpha/beta hydrolase n=1 Tax=Pseudoclavibacter endophyticus TaxID=1778590 RepID=A0A6H9WPU5_9MICO|nr:alpha/beta hydrolase [Pseudoclavibacter endophyticus]KAB1648121.1 alpha/beta hydrolase [Pseudoclavibacter endophyticus]GGA69912.1 hydrolase or acyltransferase of alpha/beta superfamily protein [Pseudoclavibacter endophyticus]